MLVVQRKSCAVQSPILYLQGQLMMILSYDPVHTGEKYRFCELLSVHLQALRNCVRQASGTAGEMCDCFFQSHLCAHQCVTQAPSLGNHGVEGLALTPSTVPTVG